MFGITLFETPASFLMRNCVMPVSEPVRGCEQDKWIFKSITILLLRLYLRVVYFYITIYCKARDIKRLQLWIFPFRFCSQPDDGCILAETSSWWCLINSLLCLGGTYCTLVKFLGWRSHGRVPVLTELSRFQLIVVDLDDWLTVHRSITLVDFQLDAQNSYLFIHNTYIKILYMFRALPCSSSGGPPRYCIYAVYGIVTLCRWLSCTPVKKEFKWTSWRWAGYARQM